MHDTAEWPCAVKPQVAGPGLSHQPSAASAANKAQDLLAIHARLFERAIELAFG